MKIQIQELTNNRYIQTSEVARICRAVLGDHENRISSLESKVMSPVGPPIEGRAPTIEGLQEMVRRRDVTIEDNQKVIRDLEKRLKNQEETIMGSQKVIRDLDSRIGDLVIANGNLRVTIVDHNKRFEEIIGIVGVKL